MTEIYDCCIFYQELDMLETRMHILEDVVDHFVIVEAAETHSGKPKPYNLMENEQRFKRWHEKIIYVMVTSLSKNNGSKERNSWERERYHRFKIKDGLTGARPNDYVIVADCDEIPNPDAIKYVADNKLDGALLEMEFMYYDLNHRVKQGWSIGMMRHHVYGDPNNVRTGAGRTFPHVNNGGWHLSYFGGAQAILDKHAAFMHHADPVIADLPRDPAFISERVAASVDLYGRDMVIEHVPLSDTLPKYILENAEHYREIGWIE